MVRILLASMLILSGCASVPKWSDNPQDCEPPEIVDLVTLIEYPISRKYICVDQPEAVDLPSYVKLLNLPPAEEKPIVAVYSFLDKTGQRKAREGIADFSTAVTQGGTEMLIDALKSAGHLKEFSLESKKKSTGIPPSI